MKHLQLITEHNIKAIEKAHKKYIKPTKDYKDQINVVKVELCGETQYYTYEAYEELTLRMSSGDYGAHTAEYCIIEVDLIDVISLEDMLLYSDDY